VRKQSPPLEERKKVIDWYYANGSNCKAAAEKFGYQYQQVYNWINSHEKRLVKILELQGVEGLSNLEIVGKKKNKDPKQDYDLEIDLKDEN
jgi:transposase